MTSAGGPPGMSEAKRLLLEALNGDPGRLAGGELGPVSVAVVDSGVDASHPALRGRVASAWVVEAADDDAPATVRPADSEQNDVNGHGTGVAGIVADVAPNAVIHDYRTLDEYTLGKGRLLLAGFRRAVADGRRVVNLSLACQARFRGELLDICETAYRNNQVVVAAMRNLPLRDNGFPAELSACIAVGMDALPSAFHWRYRGDHPVEWLARGENIESPAPGGLYRRRTGTSFATPTVSGLVALLLGRFPELRPYEVKTLLKALAGKPL